MYCIILRKNNEFRRAAKELQQGFREYWGNTVGCEKASYGQYNVTAISMVF